MLNVFLVHRGEVIDRVVSMTDGTFTFPDLAPGEYSILALGQAGLGMAGFELIDESRSNRLTSTIDGRNAGVRDQRTLAAVNGDPYSYREFAMQVAPLPQAMEWWENEIYEEPPVVDESDEFAVVDEFGNPINGFDPGGGAIGSGGFSTGGGGGGGGGGGFGGGLIGLAGLAGLAGLGGNNDDPIIVPPDPISPVR